MDIEFQDSKLERLAYDASYMGKWPLALVRAYRKRINQIMQVPNRQVLYKIASLRLEKLKGKEKHLYSVRINDQYRVLIQIRQDNNGETIVIVKIEDYH